MGFFLNKTKLSKKTERILEQLNNTPTKEELEEDNKFYEGVERLYDFYWEYL